MTSSGANVCIQAVVLAAGRGARMGALTERQPKCLCALAGRPILAWTLDALRANGVERVLAIGGWRHELLVDWVDQVIVNNRWEQSNMVRSLLLADEWLNKGPTLIVYGDGAYGARAICAALQGGGDLCLPVDRRWLSLWNRRFADPLCDAESLRTLDGRLTNIGQRPSALHDIDAQFMGSVAREFLGMGSHYALVARLRKGIRQCGGRSPGHHRFAASSRRRRRDDLLHRCRGRLG